MTSLLSNVQLTAHCPDDRCKYDAMISTRWYAARTAPRHEKKVCERLRVREIDSFTPLYTSRKRWRNRMTLNTELPLFPGYVFLQMDFKDRVRALAVPVLGGLVTFGGQPSPVEDAEIEVLKGQLRHLNAEPHPYIKVGEKVRVRSGPLAGMEGLLTRKKQDYRFVLSMDLIMQSVSVQIDAAD